MPSPRRPASRSPLSGARLAAVLLLALIPAAPSASPGPADADARLGVASRLLDGGVYDQAMEIALSILNDPAFREPENAAPDEAQQWLARREAARFSLERARFGLAGTKSEYLDVAEEFALLFRNRYRLAEPAYSMQSAYWAGRCCQEAGEYERAAAMYARVGGSTLPAGMEGDAARRASECLRETAEAVPHPGTPDDRRLRARLLDQAIDELDRARRSFPVGRERKELELDLIALRLARREDDYAREALAEASSFMKEEAARGPLRARAALYRATATERLGDIEGAVAGFRAVLDGEDPDDGDRREARLGLALVLRELSESRHGDDRTSLLRQSADAFRLVLADADADARWDRARTVMAMTLLELNRPTAALEAVSPVLERGGAPAAARYAAGRAELALGRLEKAVDHLYAASRPSSRLAWLKLAASRDCGAAARRRGDHGLALAVTHQASRLLRGARVYQSLLDSEFSAMEALLQIGKSGGTAAPSVDEEFARDPDGGAQAASARRDAAMRTLAEALGTALAGPAGVDAAYDLAVAAEAASAWAGAGPDDIETALGVIGHLRNRRPDDGTAILSREGEARFALVKARAAGVLTAPAPDMEEVGRVLAGFTRASDSYQVAAGGGSGGDALDQGAVNLASGAFLLRLSEKWSRGDWAAAAMDWRREAEQRIAASLRPFEQALARSAPGAGASLRARWLRAQALELLREWRPAATAYAWLMNNPETPRVLKINAARHWASCMELLDRHDQALPRLAALAGTDAEAAFLAGRFSERLGDFAGAYRLYRTAADPANPAAPPETPGRRQEAAYRAAKLALERPGEVDAREDPAKLRSEARGILEAAAAADPAGEWTVNMLQELGRSWIGESPDGWRQARRLAMRAVESPSAAPSVVRAMRMLAAEALRAGGELSAALDELDHALDGVKEEEGAGERAAAAAIVLAMADIYGEQGRFDDAVRAYADVFASYPDAADQAEAARVKAARLLLAKPGSGEREREQAQAILAGVRDRALAEEIMRARPAG